MLCPRDGTILISPEESGKSVFSRNGIFHCPTCAGLALNSEAASSEICSKKLESMHDGFMDEGTPTDICCPFCEIKMKVRDFAFRKIDGSLTELIEIDGCPNAHHFGLILENYRDYRHPMVIEMRTMIQRLEHLQLYSIYFFIYHLFCYNESFQK